MSRKLAALHRLVLLIAAAGLTPVLVACSGDDDLGAGTAFTQALGKAYTDLSAQAAALPAAPVESSFFQSLNPFSSEESSSVLLAQAFAAKAQAANAGVEPEPESGNGPAQATIRTRLVRALAASKDQFPQAAASAEADYDCWVIYGAVEAAAEAAQACRARLETSLTGLENPARLASAPPPAATPDAPPSASAPTPVASASLMPVSASAPESATPASAKTNFTVYFDFDSWTLKAEQLTVLDDVIAHARSGGQGNIVIVGHTDTSGAAGYNQTLSLRRAGVVLEALVQLGARRAALHASGVGEQDLAVQTGDGVKEARNRRTVIDLRP
jgi:outer membrane protein OmpA-like peptidoglycan-associated protein